MFGKKEIEAAVRDALAAFGRRYDEALTPHAGTSGTPGSGLSRAEQGATLGARLCAWAERVALWNQRVDLTAARSVAELVDLLLSDALALTQSPGAFRGRSVDVGSGAGAPGLAVALLRPELELTLVEPKHKRVAFLRGTVGALGRPDIRVERCGSEDLPAASFEVAISRATFEPAVWRTEGLRLAERVWVLLARQELEDDVTFEVVQELDYTWPLTGVTRRALAYERRKEGSSVEEILG